MSPTAILSVFHTSHSLRQRQIDALLQAGVPSLALGSDPGGYVGYTLAADCVVFNGRYFDFARDLDDPAEAVTALLIAARDEGGDVVDIVAARPCDRRIATWVGRVSMLGQQNLWAPRLGPEMLRVHPDPITWLADDRRGIVIIDTEDAKLILPNAGPLLAASIEHGIALQTLLRLPEPQIMVPQPPSHTRGGAA